MWASLFETGVTFLQCGLLIVASFLLFYELLRLIWGLLPRFQFRLRTYMLVIMILIFLGHTLTIWMYACAYWLLLQTDGVGRLSGEFDGSFHSVVYFSVATYSSLGFGDIFPHGRLRVMAGVEALNGLVLIGWSVSLSYFAIQNFWEQHPRRRRWISRTRQNRQDAREQTDLQDH